jgi:hypothetical protein
MMFTNNDITKLLEEYKSFQIEGFNIFGIGSKDDLPHIVCVTPDRSTAKVLHALLEIAKKAHDLQGIDGYITGDAALVPQVLATGHIALTALVITDDETIFKDGAGVEFDATCGTCIEAGTPEYDEFIAKLRKA